MAHRKWLSVLLSAMLAASLLAACSNSGNSGNAGTTNSGGDGTGGNANSSGDATVEISVASMPKYPPNNVPNDYITEVEKKFNMEWDFQSIPLSAGMEKYNVMYASGDYPDFIPNMNSPSSVAKWASGGYLLPIGDYIDQLPTYRALFSDEDWELLLDFGSTNGKLYMLPSVATNDPMTWIYRKDAFEQAGITSFPTTLDELHEALKSLKAEFPGSVGIGVRGGNDNTGINNLMNGFRQAFRNPNNTHTNGFWNDPDEGGAVVWNMASPKHREMLTFLSQLYKEGLIEPEFATITKEQWATKRLTGKVLLDFQWASHTVDPEYELKDIPGGQWDYARTLPSATDQPALEFKPLNFSLFGPIFSNKLADQPDKLERLFDYVEWGSTPEGQLFHQMGLEGVTYANEGGKIDYIEGYDRQKVAEQHGFDWWLKQSEEKLSTDPMFQKKQEAMTELADMFNTMPKSAALTEEEQQTINTTVSAMQDIAYQYSTKAVMGIVDPTSDKEWESYLSDLEKVGMSNAQAIYEKYLTAN
ncbi:extracellular solute-binding protein [Paenibacillus sp. IB182496]|uniref:Extracellular solute-binding protein n=1 Tax=Paenibacillus sabuli TaxID=2772509 RepID=A0A927BZ24_9BACL|nr:extracellular solute-binding protein [Paenibacillus sabuli]MBD2847928.1 extracellular solute-binding protein [Paenibacillus sabuli]